MPGLQTIVNEMNVIFGARNVRELSKRRELFALDKPLGSAGVVVGKEDVQYNLWQKYLAGLPPAIQKTIQAVVYLALDPAAPRTINWSWAPGYDYEITVWDVPDNSVTNTPGGITLLIKSPYPKEGSKRP
ncbi:MAG: hypothetical protein KGM42_00845 [Hyphomicrobiales bacterium]|nr:hypothetical protein [Hyphomicrobiales bacterium]